MNEREMRMNSLGSTAGVPKNPFRICAQADGAHPFPMLELSWGNCLGVLGGQDRTIGVVQNLRGRRAQQCPAEEAGVCRHGDEIKSAGPGKVNDLSGGIARQQDSRTLSDRKLSLEERVQLVPGKALLL